MVVVPVGVNVNELPGTLPGTQMYVFAPETVKVTGLPKHTDGFLGFMITVGGVALTVIVAVAVLLQPFEVPVTIYDVFEAKVGVVKGLLIEPPGFHE